MRCKCVTIAASYLCPSTLLQVCEQPLSVLCLCWLRWCPRLLHLHVSVLKMHIWTSSGWKDSSCRSLEPWIMLKDFQKVSAADLQTCFRVFSVHDLRFWIPDLNELRLVKLLNSSQRQRPGFVLRKMSFCLYLFSTLFHIPSFIPLWVWVHAVEQEGTQSLRAMLVGVSLL